MLVLRFSLEDEDRGRTSTEVETPLREVMVGSDPTVDVTLQNAGLAPRAVQLKVEGDALKVTVLRSGQTAALSPGNEITIGKLAIKLIALPKPADDPARIFGSYDDDPALPPQKSFELSPLPSAPPPQSRTPSGTPARDLPRADAEEPAEIGLGEREKKQIQAAAAAATAAELLAGSQAAARKRAAAQEAARHEAARHEAAKHEAAKQEAARRAALREAGEREAARNRAANRAASRTAVRQAARTLTPAEKAARLKPVKFDDPKFGEALYQQLKRAPFFAFSIAFHVLIFLILMFFDTTEPPDELDDGPGAIMASMEAEHDELGEQVPEIDEALGLPQMPSDLPDLPEEAEVEEPTPKPDVQLPSPFREDMERLEDEEKQPMDIGLMPSISASSRRRQPRKPKMPKLDLQRVFNKGAAGSSNQQSAEIVRAALGSGRGGKANMLKLLDDDDILVVSGSFDHIERVLDALRLKYVKKSPYALYSPKLEDFSKYKLVFWNCGEAITPRRIAAIGKRLQKFVRNGGYLFTTDWGVANVLPHAFPGYLTTRGNAAHLPEMVLAISPAPSARDHPLLEGVFHRDTQGKWWLEQASFDMAPGKLDAVTVLIECPMLKSTFNRSSAVAATFHYGRGRVLHTLGHYYQEAGNLAGTLSAHRMALNFVLLRLDQDNAKSGRRER